MMIYKLSIFLTNLLCNENIIYENDRDTYEYGFQITMANIINFIIVIFIGFIFQSIIQALLFYSVFISIRIYSGGFHAKSYGRCFALFALICIVCMGGSYLLMNSWFLCYISILAVITQSICTYKMAPMEHDNRPLNTDERKKFRARSWQMFFIWVAVIMFSLLNGKAAVASMVTVTLISVSILMIMAYLRGGE